MHLGGSSRVESQAEFGWVLESVAMAEWCPDGDGTRWGTAGCVQSRKKEVVLWRKTCRESLACIWFVCF